VRLATAGVRGDLARGVLRAALKDIQGAVVVVTGTQPHPPPASAQALPGLQPARPVQDPAIPVLQAVPVVSDPVEVVTNVDDELVGSDVVLTDVVVNVAPVPVVPGRLLDVVVVVVVGVNAGTQRSSPVPRPPLSMTQSTSLPFISGSSFLQSAFLQALLPSGVGASKTAQN